MRKFILTKTAFLVTRQVTLTKLIKYSFVTRQVTMAKLSTAFCYTKGSLEANRPNTPCSKNANLTQISTGLLGRALKKSATERTSLECQV